MATKYLFGVTLDQAESMYRTGAMDEDQWEAFAHAWRTSSQRYGSVLEGYAPHPERVSVRAVLEGELSWVQCCRYTASA